jgi:hypothetical protein
MVDTYNLRRFRPKLWREETWLLPHDNAPSHTSVLTQQFLAKNEVAVIPHPLYSPDLASCDFFLFPKMKLKLKGRRFDTIKEIQAESQRVRGTLIEKDFQEAFQIKRIPSIFKDESTGSCICMWKLAVAVATYVSICIV